MFDLSKAETSWLIRKMTPVPSEVSLLALAFQSSLELVIKVTVLGSDTVQMTDAQSKVVAILEVADEAMSRGRYGG